MHRFCDKFVLMNGWPSKSVPGGCVIGLFGVGAILYGMLALLAAWMIWQKDLPSDRLKFLLVSGAGCLTLGLIVVAVGIKVAMRIPKNYDPFDPDEPRMKF